MMSACRPTRNIAPGLHGGYPKAMIADPAPGRAWGFLTFAVPPAPADLRERLEALSDGGAAHLAVIQATQPAAAGPAYSDRDLLWLERFPLPLLFVFEGRLAGGWLALALACDLRACDEGSEIDTSGLSEAYARRRLEVLRASGLLSPINARAAFDAGLVTIASQPRRAFEEASRLADVIASRGPIAVRLAKEAIWRGLAMDFEQALRFETDLTLLLQTTKDRAEGVRAFLEKRQPHFTGD
jgi:enoyl-CoA hydratase/carnithine racemase